MPTKKNSREINSREEFMLGGKLSELEWVPRSEEQVNKDLFKGSDPEKMIDAFEEQLGIKTKDEEVKNQVYKCVDIRPFDDDGRELLQKFYNNPDQYQLISRLDNWTPRGDLIIFLEYYENLDVRLEKEQEKQS